jgi:hypothetical protein
MCGVEKRPTQTLHMADADAAANAELERLTQETAQLYKKMQDLGREAFKMAGRTDEQKAKIKEADEAERAFTEAAIQKQALKERLSAAAARKPAPKADAPKPVPVVRPPDASGGAAPPGAVRVLKGPTEGTPAELQKLKAELDKQVYQKRLLQEALEAKEAEEDRLRQTISELRSGKNSGRSDSANADIDDIALKMGRLTLDAKTKQLSAAESENVMLKTTIDTLKADRARIQVELAKATSELVRTKSELTRQLDYYDAKVRETRADADSQIGEANARLDRLKLQYKNQADTTNDEVTDLRNKLAASKLREEQYKEQIATLESSLAAANAALKFATEGRNRDDDGQKPSDADRLKAEADAKKKNDKRLQEEQIARDAKTEKDRRDAQQAREQTERDLNAKLAQQAAERAAEVKAAQRASDEAAAKGQKAFDEEQTRKVAEAEEASRIAKPTTPGSRTSSTSSKKISLIVPKNARLYQLSDAAVRGKTTTTTKAKKKIPRAIKKANKADKAAKAAEAAEKAAAKEKEKLAQKAAADNARAARSLQRTSTLNNTVTKDAKDTRNADDTDNISDADDTELTGAADDDPDVDADDADDDADADADADADDDDDADEDADADDDADEDADADDVDDVDDADKVDADGAADADDMPSANIGPSTYQVGNNDNPIDTFLGRITKTATALASNMVPFALTRTSDDSFAIEFPATAEHVRYFVRALTDDLLVVWGRFSDPALPYWTQTVVPLLTALAVSIKNDFSDDALVDALLSEVLFVMAVGLCGHQSDPDAKATEQFNYVPAVYSKKSNTRFFSTVPISGSYTSDPVVVALAKAARGIVTNQYGQRFSQELSKTELAGMPVPLLRMALEVAKTHTSEPSTGKATEVTIEEGKLVFVLRSKFAGTSAPNAQDLLCSVFGMPIFKVLYAEKVGEQFRFSSLDYTFLATKRANDALSSQSYTRITGALVTKFIAPYSAKYKNPISIQDDRIVVLPLYSLKAVAKKTTRQVFSERTEFPDAIDGSPSLVQLTYAVEAKNPTIDDTNVNRAFVDFLFELASLEEIWICNDISYDNGGALKKYNPLQWLQERTAWAYKIAGSVLFTPFTLKGETNEQARSFFQRLAAPPAGRTTQVSKVRVFGVNYNDDYSSPTTVESAFSLRPRFTLGSLLKRLSGDKENSADITLYRNVLKTDSALTELFASTDSLTVLVPNNIAIGYYEGEKTLEYRELPANERARLSEGQYVKAALAEALRYYMFDGDVSFARKRNETVVLASKKTDANGVSLRLYVDVDANFNSDKGGFVLLSGARDGTRPVRARLSGKVLSKTGRYYVIDHIVGPAVAQRRASQPGYVPDAAYVPPPSSDRDGSSDVPPPSRKRDDSPYGFLPTSATDDSDYQSLPASAGQSAGQSMQQGARAVAGETVESACGNKLLESLEDSDRENRLDFEAFYKAMPEAAKKVFTTAIAAQRALHIYVPERAVLKAAAAGLGDDVLAPIMLAHVGLNEYSIVSTGQKGEGKFDRNFVLQLIKSKLQVDVLTLQDKRTILLGVGAVPGDGQIQVVAEDLVARKSTYIYKPSFKSTAQSTFYRGKPIYVHFVNRVLLPGAAPSRSAVAAPSEAPPNTASPSNARTVIALAKRGRLEPSMATPLTVRWEALVKETEQSLRNETDGDRLLAHVRQLDTSLTDLGNASAFADLYNAEDVARQRSQLDAAISQNDNFNDDAAASADARAAVKDLYDRF